MMILMVLAEMQNGVIQYALGGFEYVHKGYAAVETVEVFTLAKKVVVAVATAHAVTHVFHKAKTKVQIARKAARRRRRGAKKGNRSRGESTSKRERPQAQRLQAVVRKKIASPGRDERT